MAKKAKVGKQRKDKYYRLAKEAGYRSRAAFKLIQLNKRFEFLDKSRVVIDLCAAPGGWLQVARKNMPVSSLCIGIDLVKIKPLRNAITIQGDITTESTRQLIKKELHTWEANCVIHDGAPNVGANWLHDAFQQNQLTLSALRLTTQVLAKNGWFVTKVFRSKDYEALIRTFEKLFKKVHVWKPEASRLESAEIFVVCEKYLKPVKVDPSLLDVKAVFKDAELEPTGPNPQELLQSRKKPKKAKAEGYLEGKTLLHQKLNAIDFIKSHEYLELLAKTSEVVLNDEEIEKSVHTTQEVRECLKDIKVCGPRELRTILDWRKKLRTDWKNAEENANKSDENKNDPEQVTLTPEEVEANELKEIDEKIARAKAEEKAELKRRKRRLLKEKSKERKRKEFNENDSSGQVPDQPDLFSLVAIRKSKHLKKLAAVEDMDDDQQVKRESEKDDSDENELLVDENKGESKEEKLQRRTDEWFSKDGFEDLLDDDDDDLVAVEKHIERIKKQRKGKQSNDEKYETVEMTTELSGEGCEENVEKTASESDMSDDDDDGGESSSIQSSQKNEIKTEGNDAKRRCIDPELLALGEQIIYSTKSRRDLEESGWNRYTNNDEGLPEWFVSDEKKHYHSLLPVDKSRVEEYRQRLRGLNAKPIKKVAEAKMRKRKREIARLNRAKKRTEKVVDNPEMETKEKVREMKKIYQKAAMANKKREVTYQVVTKGKRGRIGRPKGPYKAVDKRLKKDNRRQKEDKKKKDWNKKSTATKRAEIEKSKKKRSQRRSDRRANVRARKGKA